MSQASTGALDSTGAGRRTLFGHPLGLYTLFFTELWERFSFYGMKTLLLLYMLNHFFWSQEKASGLLGTYAALAYGLPVVGGFIADKWLGARRAVILGGILLAIGHLLMAFEPLPFFYSALGFIIAGVGLLKPNVSTQVGSLYPPGDPRRDGAFTIFYMGINLGALGGPLLCDWLKEHYGYHYGFAAAGVGMIIGLIVYVIGQRKLVEFNQDVGDSELDDNSEPTETHPPHVVRDRVIVLLVVFAFVILFWTAFEQQANAMLVWADKHTNLRLFSAEPPAITLESSGATGTEKKNNWWQGIKNWFQEPTVTSGQTQSFNPFFIITLAPIFAWLWLWLDKRKRQPSTPTKMVLGLAFVMMAFGVMWPAAYSEGGSSQMPLAEIPDGLSVAKDGKVYNAETEGDPEQRQYYGATRLRYNADKRMLQMDGVLSDLDRLSLLAASAPRDFKKSVKTFVDNSKTIKNGQHLAEVVTSVPKEFDVAGEQARKVLEWDEANRTLTITGEIKKRAEIELLASAAHQGFKEAVDKIYLDASQFRVSVWWLILFYMCLTMGELCISPVGLSLVTKLAPAKHVGLFMGGWFLATAVAEKLAQVFGAYWGKMAPGQYFLIFVFMCGIGSLLMALVIRPLKRKMHGVH
ncbi:MAG: peptide MFS transporter [Phycisphaerales bacterium]|nr:peptide MFS transporter [Phycisphaerales bacterium]